MDPERVRAYLQVACAGLGFEIGEVWWTSNESGSSTVAALEPAVGDRGALVKSGARKHRFVQLYTSKSYENRRPDLVNPPETEREADEARGLRRSSSTENLQKHVLSPRLVDAITKTTQVVWANTEKQEGLIGRSDIRLQTAVGMPVAMDANGNMCCVVMFSGSHLQSTDDAMDFLQSITQSATSSSIPCLLPVFDPSSSGMKQLPPSHHEATADDSSSLGEGVTAQFVSLDDKKAGRTSPSTSSALVPSENNLHEAPKDTFGIPMLPSLAELGGTPGDSSLEIFDEASYGIWSTIMETLAESEDDPQLAETNDIQDYIPDDSKMHVVFQEEPRMMSSRKDRLEEFCTAFLGMSVFDLADVWVPAGDEYPDCLRHVVSVSSTTSSEKLDKFADQSKSTLIKSWMGAVGRAYASGNPVWSTNESALVDPGRAAVFSETNIQTVLAVPVFSAKEKLPACVVACYSMIRSGSVPFVLRFVQQALRLLWDGLDQVQPHDSIETDVWNGLAPADLGEMAADTEMQQHFLSRKRPRPEIRDEGKVEDIETSRLSMQLQSVSLPNGETISVPLHLPEELPSVQVPEIKMDAIQSHMMDAVRSISEAAQCQSGHVNTNAEGTKRAHISAGGPLPAPQPLTMPNPLPTQVIHSVTPPSPPVVSTVHVPAQLAPQQTMASTTTSVPIHPKLPATSANVMSASAPMLTQASLSVAQQQLLISQAAANPAAVSYVTVNGLVFAATPVQAAIPHQHGSAQAVHPAYVLPGLNGGAAPEKQCRIEGCNEGALSRRPYCTRHSGNRLCEHQGCSKCAQGATRFCIAHGGGRRCKYPGCDKGARDKFYCAAHGGGKRCKHDGCTKSAVGGSSLCTAHGGGRRCSVDGCGKSAQSSTNFCVKHGGGKKCAHEGCEKVARGRTSFCASHGGGVRCKLEGCNRVAIGKLQLCRAHGGGSSRGNKRGPSPPVEPLPMISNMYVQQHQSGIQDAQPTSV